MANENSQDQLLRTPLYDRHISLQARMVDFGGWNLPVQYIGIIEEHRAVREQAGVFDVSHMGEIMVSGSKGREFLDYLLTASLARLSPQRAIYSPMCAEDGGCIDDLIVYQQNDTDYLLVVNAANTDGDFAWIKQQATAFADPAELSVSNRSAGFAQLALQGPKAEEMLKGIPSLAAASELKFFRFAWYEYAPGISVLISRTGYTGEDGFEIYCPPGCATELFDLLLAAGAVPCGLGARDSLRFEAALALYGHELSREITPLEAGLDRFVDLEKGNFIGREALTAEPKRKLIGLELSGRAIPRADYPVLYQGEVIGKITSGMFAPTIGRGCAMALIDAKVPTDSDFPEAEFAIQIRKRAESAMQVQLPFYKRPRYQNK